MAGGCFKRADEDALVAEAWFGTGDAAAIDTDRFMQITDRATNVIRSGGEWISSIDLENVAVGHPEIVEAAPILPQPIFIS